MKESIEKGRLTYIAVGLFLSELLAGAADLTLAYYVLFSDSQIPPNWIVLLFMLVVTYAGAAAAASIAAALTSLVLCKSIVSKICCAATLVGYALPFFSQFRELALHWGINAASLMLGASFGT